MVDQPRVYRMQRRAESQQATRRRIAESAAALHGTIGPSRTSISAVAAHAGVRRSTVYRHFPDEAALFDACSAHWAAENPLPDHESWASIARPDDRLSVGLTELYEFYARVERMLENLFRDETTVPLVQERLAAFHGYLAAVGETLMAGRKLKAGARRRTGAAVGHAIAFSTWKSLVGEQRLGHPEAVALMRALIAISGSPQITGSV